MCLTNQYVPINVSQKFHPKLYDAFVERNPKKIKSSDFENKKNLD